MAAEPEKKFVVSIFTIFSEFNEFCRQNPEEVKILIELRNLCIVETIITLIICGLGGLAFRFTEGAFESFYKCGVKRVKRDFLDSLWNYSHNMKEDDWKSMARRKLMEFEEQLHEAHEAGISTYTGIKSWSFINSCMYCLTIISTIGENNFVMWFVVYSSNRLFEINFETLRCLPKKLFFLRKKHVYTSSQKSIAEKAWLKNYRIASLFVQSNNLFNNLIVYSYKFSISSLTLIYSCHTMQNFRSFICDFGF